jgi:VIT1/CCC1 family predicted Fe2+/Mn2+ transporter
MDFEAVELALRASLHQAAAMALTALLTGHMPFHQIIRKLGLVLVAAHD